MQELDLILVLKEGSKIGNFVEVKKSTVGKKIKVNHVILYW